jgi:hypothetical protein
MHAVMERLDEQLQGRVAEAEEREHALLQQHARQVCVRCGCVYARCVYARCTQGVRQVYARYVYASASTHCYSGTRARCVYGVFVRQVCVCQVYARCTPGMCTPAQARTATAACAPGVCVHPHSSTLMCTTNPVSSLLLVTFRQYF